MKKNKTFLGFGRKSGVFAAAIVAVALICVLAANSVLAAPQMVAPVKKMKFRGLVVSANTASIVLRNPKNPMEIISFTYSYPVRDQMIKIMTAGGFQFQDKVTVEYAYGTTIALKLSGKPSKHKNQLPPPVQATQSHRSQQ
ncbi:MAG: hypothetical protein WAM91_00855 [Candidatus Acidiferrales bacterium]